MRKKVHFKNIDRTHSVQNKNWRGHPTLNHSSNHPLHSTWDLLVWKGNDWENINVLAKIKSIQDFWRVYNNLPNLRDTVKMNFGFFRENIRPIWEDEIHRNGGKWNWHYKCGCEEENKTQDDWLTLLLGMIGETITLCEDSNKNKKAEEIYDSSEILGLIVHVRPPGNRMSLWTKSSEDLVKQKKFGIHLKKNLLKQSMTHFFPDNQLIFKAHQDAIQNNSSFNALPKLVI